MFDKLKQIYQKRTLRDAVLVYTGSLLNGISLFLINVFLGRIFEKDLFGIFTLSVLVLSTVAEMSDFGLNAALLRFAPYYMASNQTDKLKQLVKTIWSWRVKLSVILTVGGVVLSSFIAKYVFNRPEITNYLMAAFLGLGGVIFVGFTSTYLQASQNFLSNALVQSLKGLVRLVLVVILFLFGVNEIYPYLFVYIFIPWVLFFFTFKYLPKSFSSVVVEDGIKKQLHDQIARFSFWLVIWSLSAILASRVDQIMLSRMLGLELVAVYAVAFQFIYIFSLAIQSVTAVLLPKYSAIKTNEDLIVYTKRVFEWILVLSILLGFLIYPSKFIIELIFGSKYSDSLPIYLVLSYSMLVNFASIPFSLIITAFNQTKIIAYSGLLQLLLNLLLNVILIPRFGVMGAAYTFGIGIVFSCVYNAVCSMYLLRFRKITVV